VSGHAQIGVAEDGGDAPEGRLTFATLGLWDYDPQRPSDAPPAVRAVDGRRVSITGFMYPLEAGQKLRSFCLLRTTQTCCYGPRPQYSQYLLVEMAAPVPFERLAPVTVTGRFAVDPRPEEGYIYRLAGEAVAAAAPERPEPDGAEAARRLGLPRFDFAALAGAGRGGGGLPDALLALDGRRMVLEGFVVNRGKAPGRLTLARAAWDGQAGTPPTRDTAVTVLFADGARPPPAWRPRCVAAGTLRVTRDPARWRDDGIAALADAVCVDALLAAEAGGRLPVPAAAEALAGAAWIGWIGWIVFKRRKKNDA
jgi:hypothetical protein